MFVATVIVSVFLAVSMVASSIGTFREVAPVVEGAVTLHIAGDRDIVSPVVLALVSVAALVLGPAFA